MMGKTEPTVVEDPVVTLEDIFGDLCPEGHTSMEFSEAVEGEGVEPEATIAKQVIVDKDQEEEVEAEEGLPVEYPATPTTTWPSSVSDTSPTHRTSSSSSRHYDGAVQPSMEAPGSDQLSYGNLFS